MVDGSIEFFLGAVEGNEEAVTALVAAAAELTRRLIENGRFTRNSSAAGTGQAIFAISRPGFILAQRAAGRAARTGRELTAAPEREQRARLLTALSYQRCCAPCMCRRRCWLARLETHNAKNKSPSVQSLR